MLARRTLVIEAVVGAPTTTRTPQPPKRGHDPVQHDGTPSLRLAYPQFIGPRYLVTVHGPVNPSGPARGRGARDPRGAGPLHPSGSPAAGGHLEDQVAGVSGVADGQVRYLEGVIEFYRARTDTKVTIAAERLALIAVITLPITAVSSLTACEAAQ
jgi:hypothetical protein